MDDAKNLSSTENAEQQAGNGFAVSIAFVALALAAVACFALFYGWQQQNQAKVLLSDQNNVIEHLKSQQKSLRYALENQRQEMSSIEQGVNQLRVEKQSDATAWTLLEVERLIRLANYHVVIDSNIDVARKILQFAEDRLHDLADPSLLGLRKVIGQQMATLETAPRVDVENLIVRINTVSQAVSRLNVLGDYTEVVAKQEEQAQLSEENKWKKQIQENLEVLRGLVVLRRLDKPVMPLVSPEQHANLVENIQLQLAIAEWAVLHRNQTIYQKSLDQAAVWVKRYFHENTATGSVLQSLSSLQRQNVEPDMPSLAQSIDAVKEAIKGYRPEETNTAPKTSKLKPQAGPQVISS